MSKIWVQLGKYGDCINILPLLYKDSLSGPKPRMMVAKRFASLLEGVSYVEPIVFDGEHWEIEKAVALAKTMSDDVVCTQVNGPMESVRDVTFADAGQPHARATSFQKESWKVAGRLGEWDDCLPLVFDRRNAEREEKLLRECGILRRGKRKPLILLALEGQSSPFEHADLLRLLVKGHFPDYDVMDLPKCDRFFDLIALYEKADMLVCVDSAPLHLAWACRKLPVIALAQDKPMLWHGSPWRPNHVWYCRYGDWVSRAVEMISKMGKTLNTVFPPPSIWVWSEYEQKASADWLFVNGDFPVSKGMASRDSDNAMHDLKRVPYLKDVIRMALQKAWCPKLPVILIRPQVVSVDFDPLDNLPCYSYRIRDGQFAPIVDLFSATKAFWKSILPEIPDLLLSSDSFWSQALWAIFKTHGATDATGCCKFVSDTSPKPIKTLSKSTEHNSKLCAEVMVKRKIHSRYPKVSEQLECLPFSPLMPPFAYNPSILKVGGQTLTTYRYHPDLSMPQTRLGLVGHGDIEMPGESVEDARLFTFQGSTWMSWTEARKVGTHEVASVVKIGKLDGGRITKTHHITAGGNDWTSIQKNWVFFEWHNYLFTLFRSKPDHVVFQTVGTYIPNEYKTPALWWPYGDIRGGCLVPYGDKWLRFFHSRLDNDRGPVRHRYFIGALVMNPNPPFEVLSIGKRPILYGSEVDMLKPAQRKECRHHKPNVVFPCGAVESDHGWTLAIGVNDSACAMVKVTEKDLNL